MSPNDKYLFQIVSAASRKAKNKEEDSFCIYIFLSTLLY